MGGRLRLLVLSIVRADELPRAPGEVPPIAVGGRADLRNTAPRAGRRTLLAIAGTLVILPLAVEADLHAPGGEPGDRTGKPAVRAAARLPWPCAGRGKRQGGRSIGRAGRRAVCRQAPSACWSAQALLGEGWDAPAVQQSGAGQQFGGLHAVQPDARAGSPARSGRSRQSREHLASRGGQPRLPARWQSWRSSWTGARSMAGTSPVRTGPC